MTVEGIIQKYSLTFTKAEETGREVLRVILPDAAGNLMKEIMDHPYDEQWDGTDEG